MYDVNAAWVSASKPVTSTSMIDPVGAVSVNIVFDADSPIQNDALEPGGGLVLICAGIAVEMVVSETSTSGAKAPEFHSRDTVAAAPWDAGGVQTSTECNLTAFMMPFSVVFATVHMAPKIWLRFLSVTATAVSTLDLNRNV